MLSSPAWSAALDEVTAAASLRPDSLPGLLQPASPVPGWNASLSLPTFSSSSAHAVAFIDASLPDYQTLVAGLQPGTAVYLLNPDGDELSQISQVLAGYSNLASVSIYSHGSDGALQLGSTNLNGNNLVDYAGILQSWASSFSAAGDLLLFGCDLAADATGQSFVSQIAALTGADVAASIDLTGHHSLGGDWDLEFATGSIEASDFLSDWAQEAYQNVLATYTVTTGRDVVDANDGLLSLREAIAAANASIGVEDTINFSIAAEPGGNALNSPLTLTDSARTTIDGGDGFSIQGNGATRIFRINSGAKVTLNSLRLSRGYAGDSIPDGYGGAIYNDGELTINNVLLYSNVAIYAGAIYNSSSGTLTVSNSALSQNNAPISGGAIHNDGTMVVSNSVIGSVTLNIPNETSIVLSGNSTDAGSSVFIPGGGGIYNNGTLTVNNSTISGNSSGGFGSAINNTSNGTLTMSNSTISGNSSPHREARGIYNEGTLVIRNSTVTGNSGLQGGINNHGAGTLTISNSIVAGNLGFDIFSENPVTSGGYNLVGDNSTTTDSAILNFTLASSDIVATSDGTRPTALSDILDTTLRDNGAAASIFLSFVTPQTHALVFGSPTINAGSNDLIPSGITTDQRGNGFGRIVGGTVDIGAFEYVTSRPIAKDDSFTTNEDITLTGNVITNTNPNGADSDPDSDPITIASVNGSSTQVGQEITLSEGRLTLNADGSFTYIPNPNASGSDSFTYTLSDGTTTSNPATVNLTITAVNDAPAFTKGADQAVLATVGAQSIAGWATNISAGPADESNQTLEFWVLNNNNALFSIQPFISSNGTLTYTPATNASGTATVTVILRDDGGSANNGVNVSQPQTFTITVNSANQPPVVNTPLNPQSSPEDTVWNFTIPANTFSDPEGAALTLSASLADNSALPSWLSFNAATRVFSGTPPQDFNGTLALKVTATDPGGLSTASAFNLVITPVNDAPAFTKGADQAVLATAGAQTVTGWVTNISAGPANESSQSLNFQVSTNNNALFSVLPSISPTGTLTYTPAASASGTATVTVSLKDDGGTANGGVDTSQSQTFTITINPAPVNQPPVVSNQINPQSSPEDQLVNFAIPANTFSDPEGATLTLSASLADNTALPTWLSFNAATRVFSGTPPLNFNGTLALKVTATDPGGLSTASTFNLVITPVNDAPVVTTTNSSQSIASGFPQFVPGISISDVDAGTSILTTTLTVTNGTLDFNNNLGGTIVIAGGINTSTVTLSGTLAQLNTALANLRYNSGSFSGDATLTIRTFDNGNTGSGGLLSDSKSMALTVIQNLNTLSRSGITVTGTLSSIDPVDRYQFSLASATNRFSISLRNLSRGANNTVYVRNSNGTVVATLTGQGTKSRSRNNLRLTAGTYFIEVRRSSTSTDTGYKLTFQP